jgi:hypothetical protein
MSFTLDLQKFAKKTNSNVEVLVKSAVAGVAESIIEKSPVGNPSLWTQEFKDVATSLGWIGKGYTGGRFRGNWDYGFNVTPKTEFDVVDKNGALSMSRIESGMAGKKMAGNIHYIANNLPYAQALENGHSRIQAPHGMVRLAAIEWQSIVDEQARKLK